MKISGRGGVHDQRNKKSMDKDSSNHETLQNDSSSSSGSTRNTPSPSRHYNKESVRTPEQGTRITWMVAAGMLLVGLLLMLFRTGFLNTTAKIRKNCTYEAVKTQYPEQQDAVWFSLSVGIENILNKNTDVPAVYLFVHKGGNRMHKLIEKIATHSSTCFGKNLQLIQIKSEDFTSDKVVGDYGYAIQKYKTQIKEGHVILVANLNKIPAEAAQALHSICDIHTPIAKGVVIFLTLTVQASEGTPLSNAADKLIEMWGSKLERNILDPLITRLTDQVLSLV